MVNNLSHSVRLETDDLSILGVDGYLPIYGRWTAISFSVYTRASYGDHATLINFGLRPVSNRTIKLVMRHGFPFITREDEFDDSPILAIRNGMVGINTGDGGHRRRVEQEIVIPSMSGNILEFSYLADGGEDAGRTIANAVLRKMESIVEKIRQSVLSNLSAEFRDKFVEQLADRYDRHTAAALNSFLGSINWKMLLMQSRCDDRCGNVVDFTLRHNPFIHVGLSCGAPDVTPFSAFGEHYNNEERERRVLEAYRVEQAAEQAADYATRYADREKANAVAADMMLEVLGKKIATQFAEEGRITVEKNGYGFDISPNHFVGCIDPNGGTAQLCIHTIGMSCNPIDEMVIAVLNIEHHFDTYMHRAVVHGSRGFRKPNKIKRKSA